MNNAMLTALISIVLLSAKCKTPNPLVIENDVLPNHPVLHVHDLRGREYLFENFSDPRQYVFDDIFNLRHDDTILFDVKANRVEAVKRFMSNLRGQWRWVWVFPQTTGGYEYGMKSNYK